MPQSRWLLLPLCLFGLASAESCSSDRADGTPDSSASGDGGEGGAAASTSGASGAAGNRAGAGAGGSGTPLGGTANQAGRNDVAGAAGFDSVGAAGSGGACGESCAPPSCAELQGDECQGGDCCKSFAVEGGAFEQGEPDSFTSSVDSFVLDELEVTVGRFRGFVNDYDAWLAAGNPEAGAGENRHVPGSGWQDAWTASLPANASELEAALLCESGGSRPTWAQSGSDALPINCVDWYTAFAFCIWDGGRLPTDAEAEYAAAGGSNDFIYPWGDTPALSDMQDASTSYAVYFCLADGSAPNEACSAADLPAAGSKPKGRGYFHQLDLVGSVWEWSLDWWAENYPTSAQTNYAKLDPGQFRSARGGSWDNTAKLTHAASRTGMSPGTRYDTLGVRCARNAR